MAANSERAKFRASIEEAIKTKIPPVPESARKKAQAILKAYKAINNKDDAAALAALIESLS